MQVMEHVHLAGEDEADDDIYEGFNEYDATLDTDALQNDPDFQRIIKTSHRPPTTAAHGLGKLGRGPIVPPSSLGRLGTGSVDGPGRPMTAMNSAGFTASGKRGAAFDPMKKNTGPAPPLEQKNEDTPEERIKQLEKKVNELIEESCFASARGELQLSLEKAKEAGRKERMLVRQREQISATDQINLDLTYSVLFNLANQYAINEMFTEALNTYNVIVKNKMFSNAGRLKVNMGNIYFKQRNYSKAIKLYRMALDQIPNTHKNMRTKLMQNIGITFVKLDQYNDAITSFEHIMAEEPDFQTGFNLILCYYALGDREKMKRTFMKILSIDLKVDDEDKYILSNDDKQYNLIQEVIKNDALRKIEREKKTEAERCIMMAAKIIAPAIEESFSDGYDWCNDQVKLSQYLDLSHSLEIDKAIGYLRQKDFQQAVETLKSFEKKDTKVAATAATNLSFLYILESEQDNADKYAEVALAADRYNPSALVNKGNVLFIKGDFEKAREYYREALQNDSSCVEALYNLGLSNKNLKRYEDALDSFYKLHAILRNSPQVIYQIADIYDKLGDMSQSVEWFLQLVGIVPSDATILQRLGEMYDAEGDKSQAFQFHYDSYRYNPSNISVIEWLGAYYIDSQFCEKAIQFFERAAIIQPNQVKWQLMVASCHRRSGNYQQALDTYKHIHRKFPENTECLKFLVRLCTDLGLKEAQEYATKLKKAEKLIRLREERASSGTSRASSGRRRSERPDRDTSAGSTVDTAVSGKRTSATRRPITLTDDTTDQYPSNSNRQELDASYVDPLGPAIERPKTAAPSRREKDDEFGDEELGDDLLPE